MPNPFALGQHRPVYLWAGQATVRMNRLKFMNAPVDEFVHAEAHTETGARRMAEEAGCNWAYLMYDWGFPPEVAAADWDDFRQAVSVYQQAGLRVFGYVQSSNCAFSGSYREKDWYAQDRRGRKFHYYTGRYMACWSHPEWLAHLREIVAGIVASGADGVFFDNPWHASEPLHFFGAWFGSAGCYCPRCREAFRQSSGLEIPARLHPEQEEASRTYLRWRAAQVTDTLAELAAYARSLNPQVVISANDFDAIMRPTYRTLGIDLAGLAALQDVVMIEDFAMPRFEPGLLINNALTLRTARALIGATPLSTITYDRGIGFDGLYPARRFQQAIAEAAACGVATVVKGTEYVEDGQFTLLTAAQFEPQRRGVGQYNRWLADNAGLFTGRHNAARFALLHPGEEIFWHWDRLTPLFFGVAQVLTAAGLPWRVVTAADDLDGVETLLTFTPAQPAAGVRAIHVPDLPGWQPPKESFLARHPAILAALEPFIEGLYRAYFEYRWFRQLGDRLGLAGLYLVSAGFDLPPAPQRLALLSALGPAPYPRLQSESPVLLEHWQQGDQQQLHLVNYADQPVRARLDFGQEVQGELRSPDSNSLQFTGSDLEVDLDVYTVVRYELGDRG
ncbi:MAG: hypothetical protein JW862_08340 [Anaerolineales bacterium]|nr:hypothetical protein [Anaerolineales bacterium]